MAARQTQMKIRRIVVGLDFAPHSQPALAAAAMLAGDLDAELDALFVESEELHRLAGMPFARETGYTSAAARPIDPAALERSLRAHADEARRALSALAEPRALRWTLRVTRGSVTEELLAASLDADLAIMGVPGWSAEAVRLATGAPSTLLVLPPTGRVRGPLVAICPVEVAPDQAVSLLCSLANAVGDGLTVLVVGGKLDEAKRWCEEATRLLQDKLRRAQLEIVRDGQAEALEAALKRLAPRALAIVAPARTAGR
jgi:nucleotide-binding universal stress UspA family protein